MRIHCSNAVCHLIDCNVPSGLEMVKLLYNIHTDIYMHTHMQT